MLVGMPLSNSHVSIVVWDRLKLHAGAYGTASVPAPCHRLPPPPATAASCFPAGGVVSGLGKGVTASSIGVLLKACGHRVTSIKIDPYLNVDAGTMSPFEHGEVFVLDDGGEVRGRRSTAAMTRHASSCCSPSMDVVHMAGWFESTAALGRAGGLQRWC